METFDWMQFITSGERYQVTNMAYLLAKPAEFWIEQVKEPTTGAEYTVRSGNVSLDLFLDSESRKSDIMYAFDKINILLLNDKSVKTYGISSSRRWNKYGQELLPDVEIIAKVVIVEDNK